jgi:hypothetical protein
MLMFSSLRASAMIAARETGVGDVRLLEDVQGQIGIVKRL